MGSMITKDDMPAKPDMRRRSSRHVRHTSMSQQTLLKAIFQKFAIRLVKLDITDFQVAIARGLRFLKKHVEGGVVLPPALESKLKQPGSWKNLEEMHKYCRGLIWDANLLARISHALEVTPITQLYEEDDSDDYYTSELAEAYLDDNDFTDDESTDRSDSIGSKDDDFVVPQKTSDSDPVTAAAAASVPLHDVVPGTDDVEGKSELAEAKNDPPPRVELRLTRANSTAAMYGQYLTMQEASQLQSGEGGLEFQVRLYPDSYKNKKHCKDDGTLKPRRPNLQARIGDFLGSLVRTHDDRWIFSGILNGWPAMQNLQVLEIRIRLHKTSLIRKIKTAARSFSNQNRNPVMWHYMRNRTEPPTCPDESNVMFLQVRVRQSPWSRLGYSKEYPGLVFHFHSIEESTPAIPAAAAAAEIAAAVNDASAAAVLPLDEEGPMVSYGTGLLNSPQAVSADIMQSRAVRAHHFAHRYAKAKEGIKDKLTWHAAVLLEWDHGRFTTVVELAWFRGVSGYRGKANWCEDKNAPRSKLYDATPDCMKGPWDSDKSELRVYDHPAKDLEEFKTYLDRHTGAKGRFFDPTVRDSAPVRVTNKSLRHIYIALLNYDRHNQGKAGFLSYKEVSLAGDTRNCQTFAADFFRYLTLKPALPFTAVMRNLYTPHIDYFFYDYQEE